MLQWNNLLMSKVAFRWCYWHLVNYQQERVSQHLRILLQRESALEAKMQTLQTMLYVQLFNFVDYRY